MAAFGDCVMEPVCCALLVWEVVILHCAVIVGREFMLGETVLPEVVEK